MFFLITLLLLLLVDELLFLGPAFFDPAVAWGSLGFLAFVFAAEALTLGAALLSFGSFTGRSCSGSCTWVGV